MLLMPKSISQWVRWRFERFNGSPVRLNVNELQVDAQYDFSKSELTKTEINNEVRESLEHLASIKWLTKQGSYYIGDHYREDSKHG